MTATAGCQWLSDYDDGTTTVSRTEGFATFSGPGEIDEVAGTYRGVAIGDPPSVIRRVFGAQRPAGEYESFGPFRYPEGGYDGPWVLQFGDYDPFGPTLRSYDVVFVFKGRHGLGAFVVVEPGTVTARGVRIGDALETAGEAYPELECGTVNENTEYVKYPACEGKLGLSRFIWFGGDPIKSITVSTHSFGGL
jgi:hypothetical protein